MLPRRRPGCCPRVLAQVDLTEAHCLVTLAVNECLDHRRCRVEQWSSRATPRPSWWLRVSMQICWSSDLAAQQVQDLAVRIGHREPRRQCSLPDACDPSAGTAIARRSRLACRSGTLQTTTVPETSPRPNSKSPPRCSTRTQVLQSPTHRRAARVADAIVADSQRQCRVAYLDVNFRGARVRMLGNVGQRFSKTESNSSAILSSSALSMGPSNRSPARGQAASALQAHL